MSTFSSPTAFLAFAPPFFQLVLSVAGLRFVALVCIIPTNLAVMFGARVGGAGVLCGICCYMCLGSAAFTQMMPHRKV